MRKDLFSIGEVGKVCSISRTSLRRLEQKGLVVPAYTDEQSGYRYYDNYNINKILQIKAFREMGLTYDDILEFYSSGGSSSGLVQKMKNRVTLLSRTVTEMELWNDDKKHLSCELIELPDYVCYAREFSGATIEDRYRDMYDLCTEAFKKGYRMLATEPMCILQRYEDFFAEEPEKEFNYICCIPLEPDCASDETTVIPGGKALSILYYGGNTTVRASMFTLLVEKMNELHLKPAEYFRGLCLVAPYMGKEIKSDKFVSRYILTVKE